MEDLIKVLNFDSPQRIDSQDISSNYFIHKPLDSKSANVPWLQNEEISFITNANSNQYLDTRASYIFFKATVWQSTTRPIEGPDAVFDTYILNSGLPFSAVRETVNNNTLIYEMTDGFNRFSQARFYCSSKPLHNKSIAQASSTSTYVNDDFDYSISEEYAGCGVIDRVNRSRGITLYNRNTQANLALNYIYFYVPLNCVSSLANCNQLLPIGYLSQVSQIGHRIDLRVIANNLGINRANNTDTSLINPRIEIYEPQLIGRYLTIHNTDMQLALFNRFKRIDPESPLLVPYINFVYDASYRFYQGDKNLKCRYNISKRSLKGMIVRFSSDTLKYSEQIDGNIVDELIIPNSIQVNLGGTGKYVPVQKYTSKDISSLRSYSSQLYHAARHIFDPNNCYSTSGCLSRSFYNISISAVSPRFLIFDFENFRMSPDSSEDVSHANGENTFVLGNSVELIIDLEVPVATNLTVETYFAYSSTLYISDNYIDNVENKTLI